MERNTLVTGCMCRQGSVCVIPLTAGHCQVYPPRAAKFMGPAWGPPGSCRPQMGPMNLAIRGHLYPQTAAGEDWNPLLSRLLFLLNEQPAHGLLNRYVKLRVAHAPGMPGTFSPSPRVSDPDKHHDTCLTHVPWCMSGSLTDGFLWSRLWGKCSRHSRHMHMPQFDVSGKRSIVREKIGLAAVTWVCSRKATLQHHMPSNNPGQSHDYNDYDMITTLLILIRDAPCVAIQALYNTCSF